MRESEAKIRRLVDSSIIGIFFWIREVVLEADAFLRMVEIRSRGSYRPPEPDGPDAAGWRERDARMMRAKKIGQSNEFENEYCRKER